LAAAVLEYGEKFIDALESSPHLSLVLLALGAHQQIFFDCHLAEDLTPFRDLHEPAREDVFGRQRSNVGPIEPKCSA
jgi:hypothetical protein